MEKKVMFLALDMVLATSVFASGNSIDIMREKGLMGKVSVALKDSRQKPIEGAPVHFLFENGRGKDGYQETVVDTDKNGMASAEGRIRISVIISIRHTGYHWLHKEYPYITTDTNRMEGDRWNPYGQLYQLTLYERRNHAEASWHTGHIQFPLSTNDFKIYLPKNVFGKTGINPSSEDIGYFRVLWNCETNKNFKKVELAMSVDGNGGFLVAKRGEKGSGMEYPYEFPTNGYSRVYSYESAVSNKILTSSKFNGKTEMLMFQIDSVDGKGARTLSYGIIERLGLNIDRDKGWGSVDLDYILNVKPNDTTCEYDYY